WYFPLRMGGGVSIQARRLRLEQLRYSGHRAGRGTGGVLGDLLGWLRLAGTTIAGLGCRLRIAGLGRLGGRLGAVAAGAARTALARFFKGDAIGADRDGAGLLLGPLVAVAVARRGSGLDGALIAFLALVAA